MVLAKPTFNHLRGSFKHPLLSLAHNGTTTKKPIHSKHNPASARVSAHACSSSSLQNPLFALLRTTTSMLCPCLSTQPARTRASLRLCGFFSRTRLQESPFTLLCDFVDYFHAHVCKSHRSRSSVTLWIYFTHTSARVTVHAPLRLCGFISRALRTSKCKRCTPCSCFLVQNCFTYYSHPYLPTCLTMLILVNANLRRTGSKGSVSFGWVYCLQPLFEEG